MLIFTIIIFGFISILDALLLYTYFAIKQVNFIAELRKLFIQQNGWVFLIFNLLHSFLFAYTMFNFNIYTLIFTLFTTSIYLFPSIIQKILTFKFTRKQKISSKYNLTGREERNLLSKLKRSGASEEFIQSIKQELKEKK